MLTQFPISKVMHMGGERVVEVDVLIVVEVDVVLVDVEELVLVEVDVDRVVLVEVEVNLDKDLLHQVFGGNHVVKSIGCDPPDRLLIGTDDIRVSLDLPGQDALDDLFHRSCHLLSALPM